MRQQMLRGFRLVTREEMLIADTAEASLRMDTDRHPAASSPRAPGGCSSRTRTTCGPGIARAVGDLRGYYEIAYSPVEPRVRRQVPPGDASR